MREDNMRVALVALMAVALYKLTRHAEPFMKQPKINALTWEIPWVYLWSNDTEGVAKGLRKD
jgi:hypothetical protein